MGADAKRKEARKRKFGSQTVESHVAKEDALEAESVAHDKPAKKKTKRVSQMPTETKNDLADEGSEAGDGVVTEELAQQKDDIDEAIQKAQRFIVFVGNLPYTATDNSIRAHFAKVHPKSIRHRTDKETGKSKGFAFLEFEGYDRMKTCLKLFHQIDFDDGVSPARKLNVELTVGGGGGKSKDRKIKLKTKNERLNEQRKRRLEEEAKQVKGSRKAPEHKKGSVPKHDSPPKENIDNGDIHPSRRSRVAK